MENASKALIIAGAILLSIAIIGLGMAAFNSVGNITGGQAVDELEVSQFNSKFLPYEGTSTGSKVKTLLGTLRTHNLNNQQDKTRCVGLNGTDRESITTENITTFSNSVGAGKTYEVTLGYDEFSGFVNMITITEKTKSGGGS